MIENHKQFLQARAIDILKQNKWSVANIAKLLDMELHKIKYVPAKYREFQGQIAREKIENQE